jgi:16S rRNA G966 N2-methylase RsmD
LHFIKSIKQSFVDRGVLGTFLVTITYISDYFFDLKYGIETASWAELSKLKIYSENIERGKHYQPTHVLPLKKFLKKLDLKPDNIIVDLGSGKGRVLIVAAECGFKEVHGVEFSKILCNIAEKNCTTFLQKTGSTAVLKTFFTDVTKYSIKKSEDVFFLNNPFDDVVLRTVIENIKSSLKIRQRRIWIIYSNPIHKGVIENDASFFNIMEYQNLRQDFLVYSNYY